MWALATGGDPLAATRAAGRMLAPRTDSPLTLLLAAGAAHGALTLGWTAVLRRLPGGAVRGAGYGAAIAALDLGLARVVGGARFAAINELPVLPQVADHVVFGVAAVSRTGRGRSSAPRGAR